MKIKDIFCAPENPNEYFNRNLCRINWTNWHNWGHVLTGILGTFCFSWELAVLLLYGWEILDGFKPHYSKAPQGKDLWNVLKRNLFYSDKFSFEDAFVFDPMGVVIGVTLKMSLL